MEPEPAASSNVNAPILTERRRRFTSCSVLYSCDLVSGRPGLITGSTNLLNSRGSFIFDSGLNRKVPVVAIATAVGKEV